MKLTAIQIFTLMYCVLDDAWSIYKDEKLAIYLSEANPFVCDDESADPVVFNDFKKQYGTERELNDYGYGFIVEYLAQLDSYYGDILSFFKTLVLDEYKKKAAQLLSFSKEQLKQKYI